jgi:hypothetical protein
LNGISSSGNPTPCAGVVPMTSTVCFCSTASAAINEIVYPKPRIDNISGGKILFFILNKELSLIFINFDEIIVEKNL